MLLYPPRLAPLLSHVGLCRAPPFLRSQRVSRGSSRNAAEVILLAQRRTCGPRQASAPPPPHITRHPSQVFLNTDRAGQARPAGAVPRLSPGSGRRPHRGARRERGPGPRPGQEPPPHCVGSRQRGGERGGRAAGTGG